MRTRAILLTGVALLSGCPSENIVGAWRSEVRFTSGDFAAVKDLEFLYAFKSGAA